MLTQSQRQDVKSVPITSYLAGKQIFPVLETGGEYCYFSPFRQERTPSFFVNPGKNVFMDFADGNGGDNIKLVTQLDKVDFLAAAKILQSVDQTFEIELRAGLPASPQYQSFVKRIMPVTHHALTNYITGTRGIPLSIAKHELSEIHYYTSKGEFFSLGFKNESDGWELRNYTSKGEFFSLGFKNESDGWELRNPSFKGCIGQKDISIRGNRSGRFAMIFEGFIDYLSFLACHTKLLENGGRDTCFYVLNSLSLISRLPDLERFEVIFLYLDNDQEGKKAAVGIAEKYQHAFNHSALLFPGHKDFNHYLTSK